MADYVANVAMDNRATCVGWSTADAPQLVTLEALLPHDLDPWLRRFSTEDPDPRPSLRLAAPTLTGPTSLARNSVAPPLYPDLTAKADL
jgi:hypothetical protein